MDIETGRGGNEAVGQRGFAEYALARGSTAADDDFGHAGQPRKFRNLKGDIVAVSGFNARAELACQMHIVL